jgi:cell division topological specificity factor
MGLFRFFFAPRPTSAAIAKERLKIVLAHERAGSQAPDFLPKLQKELIDVIGRYVEIRDDMIRVNLGKSGETSLLEINIEIDGAKPHPSVPIAALASARAASAAPPAKSG